MDARNLWLEKDGSRSLPDKTIIERIMLRFRPIAPKPVAGGSDSCSAAEEKSREVVSKERKKRKHVRVKETKCKKDKSKGEVETGKIFGFELLPDKMSGFERFNENGSSINLDFKEEETIPMWMKVEKKYGENNGVETENIFDFELMQPKRSGLGRFNESGSSINLDFKVDKKIHGWMKLDNSKHGENNGFFGGGGVVDQVDRTVVESWMMVEGVSVMNDMWLGCTDMEKMKNLEMDVCPGLISDGLDRVQWVNLAYRKLVDSSEDDRELPADVVVWLVVKKKLPVVCDAFACTVRVVYSWRNNRDDNNNNCNNSCRKYVSQTMPCDVWRMDFGGFAWRLDSKAALSLGR